MKPNPPKKTKRVTPTDKQRMDWLGTAGRKRIFCDGYGEFDGQFSIAQDKPKKQAKRYMDLRDAIDAAIQAEAKGGRRP